MVTTEIDNLAGAIRRRRSFGLKELRPDPVPVELIERVLEAANWAPSHGKTEPWRFTVYTGEGRRALGEAFGESYRLSLPPGKADPVGIAAQRDRVWAAPVWVSLGMTPSESPKMPEIEEIMAVACAVQNAQLMATSLGLGAKITSGAAATHAHTAHFVGLEEPSRLLGFLYLGWPAVDWPEGKRRPIADKVRWVGREDCGL